MQVNETESTNTALTGPNTPVGGQELDKSSFLKLLVAQMQHQDPLEPMSNTEFVAQLAQFSGVEQLVAVNEGINILGIQQMGMSNAQASTFIGKEVMVRSDKLDVSDGNDPVSGSFKLQGDAVSVKVNIRDASGATIRTMELGPQEQGEVSFEWDTRDDNGNLVAPGSYRVDAVAEDSEGNPVSWEAQVRGKVTGVDYTNGYPELVIGSVKAMLSDIVRVFGEGEEQLGSP